ncbi:hypothetical protein [Hyphomonas sp.]|uniref:hypothetical protein n=1 Tax=Hyphomonas sp. TaxID=87 RepID=UPI0025C5E3B8|nr:hypothetical protein [Hyphomonas sp.]MBI1401433.1 hypothetical protein [Hyphomonas sp.]
MTEALQVLAALYLARGSWRGFREISACRAENRRTGEAAPLWPVWLLLVLCWPFFDAQRAVLWALGQWDAAAAIRADKREARP